jgi:hypothetical protein
MKYLYSILICSLILACKSNKSETLITHDESHFLTLDFPSMLENKREITVSQIAENIKYIPLETNSNSLIDRIMDAKFTREFIFIKDSKNGLMQFTRDGKFIQKVGMRGKGPGEYLFMRNFSIDEKNRLIYLQSNEKQEILIYSFKGDYLKSIPFNLEVYKINWVRDSIFMSFSEPVTGNEKYVFMELNSNGDTLQTIPNYYHWNYNLPFQRTIVYNNRTDFYLFENRLHFKGWYNDTVYTYNDRDQIVSIYFINLKEYKLPDELRVEKGSKQTNSSRYFWDCVTETRKYIIIKYSSYFNPLEETEITTGYIMYNKEDKSGYNIECHDCNEQGFKNDFDGGPLITPDYVNDSTLFRFIDAWELNQYIKSKEFLESKPIHPDLKEHLKNQFLKTTENQNPILMEIELK